MSFQAFVKEKKKKKAYPVDGSLGHLNCQK